MEPATCPGDWSSHQAIPDPRFAAYAPHPCPLPIRWGEGGRRPGEGLSIALPDDGPIFFDYAAGLALLRLRSHENLDDGSAVDGEVVGTVHGGVYPPHGRRGGVQPGKAQAVRTPFERAFLHNVGRAAVGMAVGRAGRAAERGGRGSLLRGPLCGDWLRAFPPRVGFPGAGSPGPPVPGFLVSATVRRCLAGSPRAVAQASGWRPSRQASSLPHACGRGTNPEGWLDDRKPGGLRYSEAWAV